MNTWTSEVEQHYPWLKGQCSPLACQLPVPGDNEPCRCQDKAGTTPLLRLRPPRRRIEVDALIAVWERKTFLHSYDQESTLTALACRFPHAPPPLLLLLLSPVAAEENLHRWWSRRHSDHGHRSPLGRQRHLGWRPRRIATWIRCWMISFLHCA